MRLIHFIRLALLAIPIFLVLQNSNAQTDNEEKPFKRNNVVLTVGHALIPSAEKPGESNNAAYVPLWGLSYEYRFSKMFLLGLKSEVEISNYIIYKEDGTALEREYPISLILYADFRLLKGWYVYTGPGIEFEKEENFFTASLGTFYEIELPGGWELVPEISYKLKGGFASSYAIGLGVCKVF